MRPIRDIAEVRTDSVLYHSAFGFARVTEVTGALVRLAWEKPGENLPVELNAPNLTRVYALCPDGGFFHRAFNDAEALRELLQVDPPEALELLLEDLDGPQRRQDLRDWVVGRNLMSPRAFDRWWDDLGPALSEDDRFSAEHDALTLNRRDERVGPTERLANPMLSPGRRLDLALIHRDEIGEDLFRKHALRSWASGGKQVKELAMAALKDDGPDVVLGGLLDEGGDAIDALIHAIRRAGWGVDAVAPAVRARLVKRVTEGIRTGSPLDSEGRLAAALTRWGTPEVIPTLVEASRTEEGRNLLRATLATLAPRRAEELALDLLDHLVGDPSHDETAQWMGGEVLVRAAQDTDAVAARLEAERPALAEWFRSEYDPQIGEEYSEEIGYTAEVQYDFLEEPIPFGLLPPQPASAFMATGLAMARALAQHHNTGRVVHPTRESVHIQPDGTISIHTNGSPAASPRPMGEAPSPTADVHAAAVLLIENLIGRPWPRNIPAHRVIPYLRHLAPELPPAALAPMDAALHPIPRERSQEGLDWQVRWQSAAVSEDTRQNTPLDTDLRLRIGYDSHIGRMKLLQSQTNQDALYISARGAMHLMMLCDGISTATAGSGDIASGITVHVVANLWEQALPRLAEADDAEIFEFIDRSLRMANQAVCEAALRYAGGRLDGRVPMGTTAVVAIARGNRVFIGWLGDSRAYLVGPYGASILTADQNQAGDRLLSWHGGFESYWDPAGFALVGYVGHFNEWNRSQPLPPQHTSLTLLPGEWLTMCSDGITDYVADSHPEVARVLRERVAGDDPDELARILVNEANRAGGGDNCTAIISTVYRP